MMTLEVIADSVESSRAAYRGGADRIELCSGLLEGGITPGYGLMEQVKKAVPLQIFAMIRPRGGDFLYSKDEIMVMKRDILVAKELMIEGVVLGVLDENGGLPIETLTELIDLARPMHVTFHRAFDYVKNPVEVLEQLCSLNVERILTSGQCNTAFEGRMLIRKLIGMASNRLIVMPGGGINEKNIGDLIADTGAVEYHISAKTMVQSKMKYRKSTLSIGRDTRRDEYQRYITGLETVKRIRTMLNQYQ